MSHLLRRAWKSSYTLFSLLAVAVATACGDSGTAPAPTVASVVVTPAQQVLAVGEVKTYAARALDAAGREIAGRAIAWRTGDATVATVSAAGVVTALAEGATTITAAVDGREGSGALQVSRAPVATVTVDPVALSLAEGDSRLITATAKDAAGRVLDGRAVTWSSNNLAAATVSATGSVTAVAPGDAVIRATIEGKVAESAVTVTAAAVASVELSSATLSIEEGEVGAITAVAKDAAGRILLGRTVTWESDDTTIATVDASGRITGVRDGVANISAIAEGRRASAVVTVTLAAVAFVGVTPTTPVLEIGESRQMQVVVRDARGRTVSGRPVRWTVEGAMASVTPNGVVTGMRHGYATVHATVDGVVGSAAATIVAGEAYAWELLYNRDYPGGTSEIFLLGVGTGVAPVKLNAGNVGRQATPSPNGNRIAFAVTMQDLTTREWINDIFAVDRNGMNMQRLTSVAGSEFEPAWSPSGGRIAYTHVSPSGRSDIWLMLQDGSAAVNLTADMPATASRDGAAWSPDGSRIAFRQTESGPDGTTTWIYTMRSDGTDTREVSRTTTGFDSRPTWSPNGSELAFARSYGGGETDITTVPATGGATRRLALPGRQSMPAWSPDGTMIAFVQDDPGRQNVYTMLPDGSRLRLRTVDPAWGGGLAPAWIRKP